MNFYQDLPRAALLAIALLFSFATKNMSSLKLKYNPSNTVFAFDIHDVLMKGDLGKMVGKFFAHPSLIFKIGDLSAGSYGNNAQLRSIINSQKPICGTWKLIEELKKSGFAIYIFSNIDKTAFEELQLKFPHYFKLFDGFHVVHNNDPKLKKPAPSAYASCKALIAEHHAGKQIIFIDDKKENIQAACKAGFKGIRFTSAEKLTKTLQPLL